MKRPAMNNNGAQRRLLSQKEAAAYLGISYWTLRELNFRGDIPYIRIGKRILVDQADLEGYIDRHKIHEGS